MTFRQSTYSDLYIQKEETVTAYSYIQNGSTSLDVGRLINNLPYWKEIKTPLENQKKKIILSCGVLSDIYDSFRGQRLNEFIFSLLKNSFTVFILDDKNTLKPLKLIANKAGKEVLDPETINKITLLRQDLVQAVIKPEIEAKGENPENYYIIDHYAAKNFLCPDPYYQLSFLDEVSYPHDLNENVSPFFKTELVTRLEYLNDVSEKISLDYFIFLRKLRIKSEGILSEIVSLPQSLVEMTLNTINLKKLPDLSSLKKLKKLKIYANKLQKYPYNLPDSLESITLESSLEKQPVFHKLTHLIFLKIKNKTTSTIGSLPNSLLNLALECPNLRHLDLSGLANLKEACIIAKNLISIKLPKNSQCIINLITCDNLTSIISEYPIDSSRVSLPWKIYEKIKQPKRSLSYLPTSSRSLDQEIGNTSTLPIHYSIYSSDFFLKKSGEEKKSGKVPHSTYRQTIQNNFLYISGQITATSEDCPPEELETVSECSLKGADFTEDSLSKMPLNHFFVQYPITSSEHWTPLPMLTSSDQLHSIVKPTPSTIRYNKKTNQYEILWNAESKNLLEEPPFLLKYRFIKGQNKISIISSPIHLAPEITTYLDSLFDLSAEKEILLPKEDKTLSFAFGELKEKIASLRKSKDYSEIIDFCKNYLCYYFQSFKNIPLESSQFKSNETLKLLTEILMQKKGVCRHRAFVFGILCHYLGAQVRLVENELHVFVEILQGEEWVSLELGGGEINLINEEKEVELPLLKPAPKPVKQEISETKKNIEPTDSVEKTSPEIKEIKEIKDSKWDSYFSPSVSEVKINSFKDIITNIYDQKHNILITAPDLPSSRAFYSVLVKSDQTLKPIYYIETAKDLLTAFSLIQVETDGTITKNIEGPVQSILKKGGTLVIQWSRFSPAEIELYKTLLDTPPQFMGSPLSGETRLINLITAHSTLPETFHSRLKNYEWPASVAFPKMATFTPLKSSSDKKENLSIDLYGDEEGWQEHLLGKITFSSGAFKFSPGVLINFFNECKAHPLDTVTIELIDAPWKKEDFQLFMAQIQIDNFVYCNGEKIAIPTNIRWQCKNPKPLEEKIRFTEFKRPQSSEEIFYLNRHTYAALFEQYSLESDGALNMTSGWLAMPAPDKKIKRLIITEELTASQMRKMQVTIVTLQQQTPSINPPIINSNTSLAKFPKKDVSPYEVHEKTSHHRGYLIETHDPYFITQMLFPNATDTLHIAINSQTQSSDLIEKITRKDPSESDSKLTFSYQPLPLVTALKAGKNVILYGQLNKTLYMALESMFGTKPTLKLADNLSPQLMKGKLIVITEPLKFNPTLAICSRHQMQLPSSELWSAYTVALMQEGILNTETGRDLETIQLFYKMAEIAPHDEPGIPEKPRISYRRLKQFLYLLNTNFTKKNPLKSLFNYDYNPYSEQYAYINALQKAIFAPLSGQYKVRYNKYLSCPSENKWHRINCFNGDAIRTLLEDKDLRTIYFNPPSFPIEIEQLPQIEKNPDPQKKAKEALINHLDNHRMVVLKGPPGSGKTHLAQTYGRENKKDVFWAENEAQLIRWFKQGGCLIVDEANLKPSGYWDFLYPLFKFTNESDTSKTIIYKGIEYILGNNHQVIFTSNPESYGRPYHTLLQDTPTVFIKSWTDEALKIHILRPLCSISIENLDEALDLLIACYRKVATLLPASKLSLRDLQQLTQRWLRYVELRRYGSSVDATYYACLAEWQYRFSSDLDFKKEIHSLFSEKIKLKDHKDESIDSWMKNFPKDLYLSQQQKDLLCILHEDITLSEAAQHESKGQNTPLAKAGFLIEGASGIGKSTLLRHFLIANGYQELTEEEKISTSDQKPLLKRFIQLTLGSNKEQDEKDLRMAFRFGYKVIIDELNLGDSIEHLLNHFLTGKTPEGEYSQYSGFFILASQNSVTMGGRKTLSPALENRFHVFNAKEYTREDLLEMTKQAVPYLPKDEPEKIVSAYVATRKHHSEVNSRTFFKGLKKIAETTTSTTDSAGPSLSPFL